MKHTRSMALALCAALTAGLLCGCAAPAADPGDTPSQTVQQTGDLPASVSADNTPRRRAPAGIDLTGAAEITLSGTSAVITGTGAQADGGLVTITGGGTYVLRGSLTEGRVVVDAKGQSVTLVLDGADITCTTGSPIYIYKASDAVIHLMEGSENRLTDGAVYTLDDQWSSQADDEPNACLYSKADLVLQGAGSLTVNANAGGGMTCKDALSIYDVTLTVNAVHHGINGKDTNTIDSADLTVTCGGDALRSTNAADETLGWVSVSDSTLSLTAGEDGIQAETAVTIARSTCVIRSGGGYAGVIAEDASAKGIKGGTTVTLQGGVYTLDCADDGVHANGSVTVSGGVYTVASGDDAFHADETLTINAGEIDITTAYEGLEGNAVTINDGVICITASDDGVNAAGGRDGSGFMGRDPGAAFAGSADCAITLSGGTLVVNARGDGLDANGSIEISAGTVIVSSTGTNDAPLDYDRAFTPSGGTLLAFDNGWMTQGPSQASQNTLCVNFGQTLSAGIYVALLGQGEETVFLLPCDANSMVYSAPALADGAACTISYGGVYSGGTSENGLCSGGAYSGGTTLAEVTLTEKITTCGDFGMGGGKGGRGQMPNAPMPDGTRPEWPADGTKPQRPADGSKQPPQTTQP